MIEIARFGQTSCFIQKKSKKNESNAKTKPKKRADEYPAPKREEKGFQLAYPIVSRALEIWD